MTDLARSRAWRPRSGGQPRQEGSLDLFWLKDESLLDAENLPESDDLTREIAEDLRSTLADVEEMLADLESPT